MDTRFKTFDTEIKAVNEGDTRQMQFLISTAAIDRDNDSIDPKGWDVTNYLKNPVVAFAHDYKSLPVAKCLKIGTTAKGLEALAEFPPLGTYPFADQVYGMLKSGFLNATSVGFRPIDFEPALDRKGFNFKSQELTEFSIVPIPSNPQALVQQRSAGTPDATVRVWCKALLDWAKDTHLAKPEPEPEPEQKDIKVDLQAIAAEVAKLLKPVEPEQPEPFFTLIDDPNLISFDDETLKNAMATLGPELSAAIAGKTKDSINQMLGRID
jgi:HK97 family phage prohead protease